MGDTVPKLTISTLFCSAQLGCEIDPFELCKRTWNVEQTNNSTATLRVRNPKATAQIFKSGKMLISGPTNETDARIAIRKIARIVQKTFDSRPTLKLRNFKVSNMVGNYSFNLLSPINLDEIFKMIRKIANVKVIYEPELNESVTYYPKTDSQLDRVNKTAITIYSSGNIKISGGRCLQEMDDAFKSVYDIVNRYKTNSLLQKLLRKAAKEELPH